MNQIKKRVNKVIHILKDAQPSFVSLVEHGANQTPFAVLKAAENHGDDMNRNQEMVNALKGAAKVQSFQFTGAQYETEKQVTEFLNGKGYEDFTVIKSDSGFEVEAAKASDFSRVSDITLSPGVVVRVGLPEESEDSKKEDTSVSGDEGALPSAAASPESPETLENIVASELESANPEDDNSTEDDLGGDIDPALLDAQSGEAGAPQEQATKFDEYVAYYSSSKDFDEVLSQGADGLPPGFYEVTQAMITATKNSLMTGESEAVKSIMQKYGDMVVKMAEVMASATVPQAVSQKMAEGLEGVEGAAVTDDEPKDDPKGDATDDVVGTIKSELASMVTKAVEDATSTLKSNQESLLARFGEFEDSAKQVSEQLTETANRIDVLENTGKSRKSLDGDEGLADGGADLRKKEVDTFTRNTLGFSRKAV